MRTEINNQISSRISEILSGDLESAEVVVVRARRRRMRGASSILETGPGVEVRRLLCGPYVSPLIRRWEHVSGVTKVNATLSSNWCQSFLSDCPEYLV